MDQYPKSEEIPDYPRGDWINESELGEIGMDEVFNHAETRSEILPENTVSGNYAIYARNDLPTERLIPLEYNAHDDTYRTVGGVFDSNPGKTQRYTSWNLSFTQEELEKEIDSAMLEAQLIPLEKEHVETVTENFSYSTELDIGAVDAAVAALTGLFR
ncbi:MAG: hypothetical protein ABEJ36_00160 [Candidatus Nanosalina sp.]